jgi:spore coat protein U-like protein
MNKRYTIFWRALMLAALFLFGPIDARADSCSASMTDIVFTGVSPIANSDYYANGTLTVTCSWTLLTGTPPLLLFPNVAVCVYLGAGSGGGTGNPRYMMNGSDRLPFNLYVDNTYGAASIWGGSGVPAGSAGLQTAMGGLLALGSISRTFTVYGKIPASALAGVKTSGNADTVYSASFAGAGSISYAFYGLVASPCTAGSTAAFSFNAKATVANNCLIATTNMAFGSNSVLTGAVRRSAAMNVQCSANTAYQVSLGAGSSGDVAARKMRNAATGETIGYTISSSLDGPAWGDGSRGTAAYTGVGSGAVQAVTMYGLVPAQKTPSPGDYKDTVIATLVF